MPQIRVHLTEQPMLLGMTTLTAATGMLAFSYAMMIIHELVGAAPSLIGFFVGMLFASLTFYVLDGTVVRRLAYGLLGLSACLTIVIDVSGQFYFLDGRAHLFGAAVLMAVVGVLLHPVPTKNELMASILYFFVGLGSVAVATIGLYLEWTLGYTAVGPIEPTGLGLVLICGVTVSVVGLRLWAETASAVPQW